MSSFYPFQKIRNEAAKVPITILGIGVEYNLSSTVIFLIIEEWHNISKGKCDILQILL